MPTFPEFMGFQCTNCIHLSGEFKEEILIGGQLVDNLLVGGWHKVGRKWGWVICGLVMYKVLIGFGENVGFLPTNIPHFLGPAKVKQHPESEMLPMSHNAGKMGQHYIKGTFSSLP